MSSKRVALVLTIVSIILFSIGYIVASPREYQHDLCGQRYSHGVVNDSYGKCVDMYEGLGLILLFVTPAAFLSGILILSYLRARPAFSLWGKFSLVYLPIAAILVAMTPKSSGGFGIAPLGPDKEMSALILATLYFILSILLIATKAFRMRGSK